MIKSMLLATFLFTSTLSVFASDSSLDMTKVEIHEVKPDLAALELAQSPISPIDEISIVIDGLMAIGKKIWPIIEAGRPVVTTKFIPAISIIPNLTGEGPVLNQMENWSIPKVKSYRISITNGVGWEVVAFTYTIIFQYNGDLAGVGKYVTNLAVIPSEIDVGYGSDFDASSELIGISNIGTNKNPVASGLIKVSYGAKNIRKGLKMSHVFSVDGLGNFEQLK